MRWRKTAAIAIVGLTTLTAGSPPARQLVLTGHDEDDLIVSGTPVDNLHPGAVRRIQVSFTNPNHFPIEVVAARGELTATSKAGCRALPDNLEIRDYQGTLPLALPARTGRIGGHVEVHMPNSVSPACQNAVFSIRLTGTATRTDR
jgi:hypothetical protein